MLQDKLTTRQQTIFDLIREKIIEEGYGPTIREIAEVMGYSSPNGVVCHLKALEKKGLINRASHKSRSITLTEEASYETSGLPLSGIVSAGALMEAVEDVERIDVGDVFGGRGDFVLRVEGDSMIDAQIASGDLVVVKRARTAGKGEIVVARTPDGEATLKYWFPEKNRIRLQPANKRLKPIYSRDAKVTGVVIGVIRQLR